MCAVDIQDINALTNRLYRKEIIDKHNIANENWEGNSVVAYPPSFISNATLEHMYVFIKCLC